MLPNYSEDDNINSFEEELGQALGEIFGSEEESSSVELPTISPDEGSN